jgi:hypothetical protein
MGWGRSGAKVQVLSLALHTHPLINLPRPARMKQAMSFDDDLTAVKAISLKMERKAELCAIQKQAWHTDVLELARLNSERKVYLLYTSPYKDDELRRLAAKIARSIDAASPCGRGKVGEDDVSGMLLDWPVLHHKSVL